VGQRAFQQPGFDAPDIRGDRAERLAVGRTVGKGVGLGIEAGFAFARGIPVLAAARAGSDISATLQGISARVCLYAREEEVMRIVEDVKSRSAAAAL
jgi:hypothetical protein